MKPDSDLIELLEKQIDKLEQFMQQQNLRIEPHLYPKGLFRLCGEKHRFQAKAYLDEIRRDLLQLRRAEGASLGAQGMLAETLLQKVSVLIASFKSQHLRKRNDDPMQALLEKIEARDQTIVDYFFDKDEEQ